jgi:Tol biopolymer transport system component
MMTFCTACASPIAMPNQSCPSCGALHPSAIAVHGSRLPGEAPANRSILIHLLCLAPVLLLFAVAGGLVQRHTAEQQWLASAYAAAQDAAKAGDIVTARAEFMAIVGYRDAAERVREIETQLEPLEAAYLDGLQAIERGDYAAAVELLAPVAEQAPQLRDTAMRLEDARRLLTAELRRDVDAAETVRDWPTAEKTLRDLVTLDPSDDSSRRRLSLLQREHGPVVLGNDRALWLVAPDGSEPRQLTDAVHVIWPVWSPDRSQIAFLAPDPEDPMGNVSLYRIAVDGSTPERLVDGVSAHAAPSWSPDGTQIAYTSFAGYDPVYESGAISVRVFDVESGAEIDLTGAQYPLAFNPSWSPDGSEIAFIVKHQGLGERPQHAPGDVMVVNPGRSENGEFENLTDGAVRDVWSVSWSPRGDELLLYSLFGQTWYEPPSTSIRLLNRTTGEIDQLAGIEERPTMPVWSPDGTRFAFTSRETSIVIANSTGNQHELEADEALSGEITWSPDGQALLLAPWDADTSSTLADLSGAEPVLSSVRFEFDASPPFISPPQWAPSVALPPDKNAALVAPTGEPPPS